MHDHLSIYSFPFTNTFIIRVAHTTKVKATYNAFIV